MAVQACKQKDQMVRLVQAPCKIGSLPGDAGDHAWAVDAAPGFYLNVQTRPHALRHCVSIRQICAVQLYYQYLASGIVGCI